MHNPVANPLLGPDVSSRLAGQSFGPRDGLSGILGTSEGAIQAQVFGSRRSQNPLIFPNNTTTFLRGDGTFAAPTASVSDPNQQSYSPGSFTLATGKYIIMSRFLKLTGVQRATLQGTSTLRLT